MTAVVAAGTNAESSVQLVAAQPVAAAAGTSYDATPMTQPKEADLKGIVQGMHTFGWGRGKQLRHDLAHKPLCKPSCRAYKQKGHPVHDPGCEHGILMRAKRIEGYTNRGTTAAKHKT